MEHVLAGVFDPRETANAPRRTADLASALGADAQASTWVEGPLTALRVPGGAAPFQGTARVVCLMSGRLFNAEKLAAELGLSSSEGHERVSASAYERWGEGMLERLRGAFALLIWDRAARSGLLAQDQTGARALFVHAFGPRLVFASEIKHLLPLLPSRPAPDRVALVHWLALRMQYGDRTLYEGVRRLGAARFLRLGLQGSRKRRYWSPRYEPSLPGSRAELADRLRTALVESVESRISGRTAGILLSGGLDSSTVAAVARHGGHSTDRPRTYSAVYPDHELSDESRLIQDTVTNLDLTSVRLHFEPCGVMASAIEYTRDWQLPLLAPGHMVEAALSSHAAADGVTVLLDGQGGDELFGGAPFLIAERVRRGRLLSAVDLARRFPPTAAELPRRKLIKWLVREFGVKGAIPYWLHRTVRRVRDPRRYAPDWLNPEATVLLARTFDPWLWKRQSGAPIWWAHLSDSLTAGWERDGRLDFIRHRAAASGVESASPLLDSDLVELALRLPPDHGFDPRMSRTLVRESMAGLMPDSVRLNPVKANFAPFWYQTLAGADRPAIERLLDPRHAEIYAYIEPGAVRERILEQPERGHWRGQNWWATSAWNLATVESWLRAQADQGFPDRALDEWGLERPRHRALAGGEGV